jgi:hypothetical protein
MTNEEDLHQITLFVLSGNCQRGEGSIFYGDVYLCDFKKSATYKKVMKLSPFGDGLTKGEFCSERKR